MQHLSSKRQMRAPRVIVGIIIIVLVVGTLALLLQAPAGSGPQALPGQSSNVTLLIPVAFLAGLLSFLSPCTLPILPAYFAFTFGSGAETSGRGRWRVVGSSLAFFAGLATTLVLTGASLTVLGRVVAGNRSWLAQAGGLLIIGFGLMSIFGIGFSGPQIQQRRTASLAGAYVYGLTFALGWTACIGPILGSILTLLAAEGGSLLAGTLLSFVYALGLGLPLMLVATFFGQLGQGSRMWRMLRGTAWEVRLAGRTLLVHSTSLISGIMLIAVGVLLASGQLDYLSRYAYSGPAEWGLQLEQRISSWFGVDG